jgi:hypothetical protein
MERQGPQQLHPDAHEELHDRVYAGKSNWNGEGLLRHGELRNVHLQGRHWNADGVNKGKPAFSFPKTECYDVIRFVVNRRMIVAIAAGTTLYGFLTFMMGFVNGLESGCVYSCNTDELEDKVVDMRNTIDELEEENDRLKIELERLQSVLREIHNITEIEESDKEKLE